MAQDEMAGGSAPLQAKVGVHSSERFMLLSFTAAIFMSAFLLFSVQPMFTKMVLPKLGGSPAVWSMAMVFFQTLLLLGYLYAHALTKFLSLRVGIVFHLAFLGATFLCLPIAIPASWATPPQDAEMVWLLGLFAVSVGLPFFAVSTNGPLLQAWFSKSGSKHAQDPYFLYAASNIGSFASLLLFIVLFEPLLALDEQSFAWSVGFAIFIALITTCASGLFINKAPEQGAEFKAVATPRKHSNISWRLRGFWILLAFIPSGLLVAITAHLSTDVASAPFLWVIPLSLFLLTFVFAFQKKQSLPERTLSRLVPVLAVLALISLFFVKVVPIDIHLVISLGFFFVASLYCHTRMADSRPDADHLTEFYLLMSFGGVLGGLFASMFSISVFNAVIEYPLLIAAVLFVRKAPYELGTKKYAVMAWALIAACCVAAGVFVFQVMPNEPAFPAEQVLMLLSGILFLSIVLRLKFERLSLVVFAAAVPLIVLAAAPRGLLFQDRSFFGVVAVHKETNGFHTMRHGTTLHGAQRMVDEQGEPITGKPVPTTYYHPKSLMVSMLNQRRQHKQLSGETTGLSVGIVGLGTGAMLCYGEPNDKWAFYEIDKSVIKAASDPNLFTYLTDCGPKPRMVLGDARLTLANEKAATFDYLQIDAFSSDAIPVHLITEEAVSLYMDKLSKDGLLVLHISNRHMNLEPYIAAIAEKNNWEIRGQFHKPTSNDLYETASHVVVVARDLKTLGTIAEDEAWRRPSSDGVTVWTDNYSNVLGAIIRHYGK